MPRRNDPRMENSFEEIDLEAENAELRDRVAKREAEAKKLADAVRALHEWRASHWLTIAKAIVLCVGLRIAVDLWTSGDATAATLMAVVTLLGMALPVFGWVITTLTDA